ncbi:uncharacterized protein LOC126655439 [Mercurialis annua]|uniref:uncharacterized protein LOC126655439 n=1 Tax=Mercurialis annua TaxID=3986 RepID=UPI00215EAA0C|nr:uncharacterized protein LOC126655439 [Mercurialis annua]
MGISGFIKGFSILNKAKPRKILHPYNNYIQSRNFSHFQNFNSDNSVLPVLIVGAGPVGLTLSILLTKLGVECAILEKNKVFSNHPQAHFINNRSMEIFRKLDGLAEEIERSQPPVDLWRKFIYCTSLTGPIIGSVDHMQPQDFEKVVSPVSVAHFSQYKLNRLLLKKLQELNFCVFKPESPKSHENGPLRRRELLMGHEFVSFSANDHCVTATASHTVEGKYIERDICCRILVGTDGAGSIVRKLAGIELRGEKDLQKLISIHFFSRDLGKYLLSERPGMLFFIFNTEAIGVLVAHDLKEGEFIMQVPFYPPQQDVKDFSKEICRDLILKLAGRELSDINMIEVKPWVMHAEVAEKFVSCNGRIVLAGDAAHRFPPAGGFGMNTGIQDVHNLAWKIASSMRGIAPSSIVHTYEMERKPIAVFNTALSVKNFKAAISVPAALGLDPSVAHSVHQAITDGIGSILPSGVQKAMLDGIFMIGRAQVSEALLNEKNPIGHSRLERVRRIFEEGKSLQLQFPAEDLGFRYLTGALVPDSDSKEDVPKPPTGRRRDYIPSADPGSRLPHMDVRILSNLPYEATISTLDLLSGDKVEFLLIVAPHDKSYQLAHAAFKVTEEFKVSTKVCVLWPADKSEALSSEKALAPWKNYIDVMEVKKSSNLPSWWSICKMTDKGAILVRPDGHIAWRAKSNVNDDPVSEMRRVFSAILGVK